VLLMDEPTSALDEASKLGIETLIRRIVDAHHLTCVIVTHDLQQAGRMAEQVALLESGTLKCVGSTREILGAGRQD
jgi:ABC-type phosphate transport system ATPase subunit